MGAGAGIPEIPFPVDQVVTALDPSWALGDRFCDKKGRIFVLWQIDSALINNTSASGEVGTLKASHVWTNDVSEGLFSGTYPVFAGMALGALPESTSTTTIRYGLFLVKGRATATITDGNVAAGDTVIVNQASAGAIIEYDETATNLAAAKHSASLVGVAMADDVSTTSCDIYVASQIFG